MLALFGPPSGLSISNHLYLDHYGRYKSKSISTKQNQQQSTPGKNVVGQNHNFLNAEAHRIHIQMMIPEKQSAKALIKVRDEGDAEPDSEREKEVIIGVENWWNDNEEKVNNGDNNGEERKTQKQYKEISKEAKMRICEKWK